MKNLKTLILSLFMGLAMLPAFAQTILTNTTLSAAVTSSSSTAKNIVVASATGISTTSLTFLWVDKELMEVQAISGTVITVARGVGGSVSTTHASGAFMFVIPASKATFFGIMPTGSCTRTNELLLPRIYYPLGIISDCIGGQWINGDSLQTTRLLNSLLRSPEPGATALTALETAGTAPSAATEIYCTEFELPYNMILTGMAFLNGTTVGTDKRVYILYDASGKALANTAVAGVVTANASTYQKINFTTPFYAVGPARYFGCTQTNGTTDTLRHAITAVNDNILGGAVTTQVFGTVANVTLPTTFTTAKAPYLAVF